MERPAKVIIDETLKKELRVRLSTFKPQFGDKRSIEIRTLVSKIKSNRYSKKEVNEMMGRTIKMIKQKPLF